MNDKILAAAYTLTSFPILDHTQPCARCHYQAYITNCWMELFHCSIPICGTCMNIITESPQELSVFYANVALTPDNLPAIPTHNLIEILSSLEDHYSTLTSDHLSLAHQLHEKILERLEVI